MATTQAVTFLLALAALMGGAAACTCLSMPFCQATEAADTLAHVEVLSVTPVEEFTNKYLVRTITLFKSNVRLPQEFEVFTANSSAACGVDMAVGDEWALVLHRSDRGLELNLCSQSQNWRSTSLEDRSVLAAGGGCCSDEGRARCSEHQQCMIFEPTGEEFCADTCEDGTCNDGEQCVLEQVQCVRAPCPPIARCCNTVCAEIFEPVCGSNDVTYGNLCELESAACLAPQERITLDHEGECCPTVCPLVFAPVCGEHPKLGRMPFSNSCFLNIAMCNDESWTECSVMPCTKEYRPICGSDLETYANLCVFKNMQVSEPYLQILHEGECCDADRN